MPKTLARPDDDPDAPLTGLLGQLRDEWLGLNNATATRLLISRWARTTPALATCSSPDDILHLIDQSGPDDVDDIFRTLLTRFQAGHFTAGRILLQAMLPRLIKDASWLHRNMPDRREHTWDEMLHEVISEFWAKMTRLSNLETAHKIPANLAMSARSRAASTHPSQLDPPPPQARGVNYDDIAAGAPAPLTNPNPGIDDVVDRLAPEPNRDSLAETLGWCLQNNVISPDEAVLMRGVFIDHISVSDDGGYGYGYSEMSTISGVDIPTLRKRVERIKRRIITAIADEAGIARNADSAPRRNAV